MTLFILGSLLFVFIITPLILKKGGGLYLNFLSIWLFSYYIFFYFGACIIISGLADNTYFVLPIRDNYEIKVYGAQLILYCGLITFPSFLFFFKLFNFKNGTLKTQILNLQLKNYTKSEFYTLNIMFIIYIIILLYYIAKTFPSPLWLSLTGADANLISTRRIDITRNLFNIANTYIISIGMVLSYLLPYAYISLSSKSNTYKLTIFSVILSCIFLLLNGEKAGFVMFILGLFLCFYTSQGKTIKISLKIILLSFVCLLLTYILFVKADINTLISLLFDRILIAQQIAVYLSLDYYSSIGDLGFNTLSNIFTKLFDIKTQEPASTTLMRVYFPEMIPLGGWNINGLFIHEAWANFGLIGSLVSPILVAFENAIVLVIILSLKKRAFTLALYSYASISITFFMTSYNAYLYHSTWIVIPIIILVYYTILNVLNVINKKQ